MRLELTRVGLLVELANHYTTKGASENFQCVYLLTAFIRLSVICNLQKFFFKHIFINNRTVIHFYFNFFYFHIQAILEDNFDNKVIVV